MLLDVRVVGGGISSARTRESVKGAGAASTAERSEAAARRTAARWTADVAPAAAQPQPVRKRGRDSASDEYEP